MLGKKSVATHFLRTFKGFILLLRLLYFLLFTMGATVAWASMFQLQYMMSLLICEKDHEISRFHAFIYSQVCLHLSTWVRDLKFPRSTMTISHTLEHACPVSGCWTMNMEGDFRAQMGDQKMLSIISKGHKAQSDLASVLHLAEAQQPRNVAM